ncbi:hypothetical protein TRV_07733 [Trichophyton verrucosum HKI 0517]|uniref:Uncharacterized protein n=1 Tax=Trichophyton verrucosum (strain HKI 0517) TaxID=663202 RepID=D4DKL1_TRIVH|nr:uncharacterized protein TRV_07733 [Trichophyton verrucosum HKI 0517]EFE37638.1 hypothetical protein TRV_07733 [Trichophyton verrucosum HKI 0517]
MAALCTGIHCSGEICAKQEGDSKRKSVKSEVSARPERVKQPKEVDVGRKEEEERGEAQGKQREREKREAGSQTTLKAKRLPASSFFQHYIDEAAMLEFFFSRLKYRRR